MYPKDLFLDPTDNVDHIDDLTDENPWSRYFNESVADKSSIDSPPNGDESIEVPWKFHVEGIETVKALLKLLEGCLRDKC